MKIYVLNTEFVDYLRKFDKNVMINEDEDGGIRKYIGVIFNNGAFNYFVPLSSPKFDSDYINIKGKWVLRRSVVPIHRIIIKQGDKENFLGKLKFSSMIPVPDDELNLLNINGLTDVKYKTMLFNQLRYIRKNYLNLKTNHAEVIYSQKINNYPNINYLNSTVDFKLLEQKMVEYIAVKKLIESSEQASVSKEE
jgi:protein AbiQ